MNSGDIKHVSINKHIKDVSIKKHIRDVSIKKHIKDVSIDKSIYTYVSFLKLRRFDGAVGYLKY